MANNFQIQGLADLYRRLEALPDVVADKAARASVRKAMLPVLATAQRLVPKRTGALYESLALTTRNEKGLISAGLKIRPVKKAKQAGKIGTANNVEVPRRYFHLVEFGSSRASAHPFIRPAFDQNLQNMLDILKSALLASIRKAEKA